MIKKPTQSLNLARVTDVKLLISTYEVKVWPQCPECLICGMTDTYTASELSQIVPANNSLIKVNH